MSELTTPDPGLSDAARRFLASHAVLLAFEAYGLTDDSPRPTDEPLHALTPDARARFLSDESRGDVAHWGQAFRRTLAALGRFSAALRSDPSAITVSDLDSAEHATRTAFDALQDILNNHARVAA